MLDRELVEAVKLAREAGVVLLDVYARDFEVDFNTVLELSIGRHARVDGQVFRLHRVDREKLQRIG